MTTYQSCPPGLKLVSSPLEGRFLESSTSFQPGDIVLGPERPYACIFLKPETRCDCCNQPGTNLRRCGACKTVYYLDAEHQRRGWDAGHKLECKALQKRAKDNPGGMMGMMGMMAGMMPPGFMNTPPPTSRLAARILWKQLQEERAARTAGGDAHKEQVCVQSMLHHWDKTGEYHKALLADVGARIWYAIHHVDHLG